MTTTHSTHELSTEIKYQLPIRNYHEFYRFYLTEHRNIMSRRLHVAGSSTGLLLLGVSLVKSKKRYLPLALLAGYACAWVGHFMFEKNKPASFKQPLYSFISDWRMFTDVVRGNLSLKDRRYDKIDS